MTGTARGRVTVAVVQETPLSVDACLAAVSDPAAGGIGVFIGVVRDHDEGRGVAALSYSAHPTAATVLAAVCAETAALPGVTAVAAAHRVGDLRVGDLAVVVAVSGPHRGAALDATRWCIDTLKERVPIWKEQDFTDGTSAWVGSP